MHYEGKSRGIIRVIIAGIIPVHPAKNIFLCKLEKKVDNRRAWWFSGYRF